jgi:hypothetical protein
MNEERVESAEGVREQVSAGRTGQVGSHWLAFFQILFHRRLQLFGRDQRLHGWGIDGLPDQGDEQPP